MDKRGIVDGEVAFRIRCEPLFVPELDIACVPVYRNLICGIQFVGMDHSGGILPRATYENHPLTEKLLCIYRFVSDVFHCKSEIDESVCYICIKDLVPITFDIQPERKSPFKSLL